MTVQDSRRSLNRLGLLGVTTISKHRHIVRSGDGRQVPCRFRDFVPTTTYSCLYTLSLSNIHPVYFFLQLLDFWIQYLLVVLWLLDDSLTQYLFPVNLLSKPRFKLSDLTQIFLLQLTLILAYRLHLLCCHNLPHHLALLFRSIDDVVMLLYQPVVFFLLELTLSHALLDSLDLSMSFRNLSQGLRIYVAFLSEADVTHFLEMVGLGLPQRGHPIRNIFCAVFQGAHALVAWGRVVEVRPYPVGLSSVDINLFEDVLVVAFFLEVELAMFFLVGLGVIRSLTLGYERI